MQQKAATSCICWLSKLLILLSNLSFAFLIPPTHMDLASLEPLTPQAGVTHVMSDSLRWPLQNPVSLSDFFPLGAVCFSNTLIPQNWPWDWTLSLPL